MTAPALIPQVWVHEARAAHLADTVGVLTGIADDDSLPTKTRQAAQTGRILLEVIASQLGEEITRAELAAAGVTLNPPAAAAPLFQPGQPLTSGEGTGG